MKTLLLSVFAFIGMSAMAQDLNLSVEGGPEITFDQETLDYGDIAKGSDGNRQFTLTNTGTGPLIISKCKGSCGCTVPKCPTEPILPGESSTIKVKYDTNRVGKFTKSITVSSNANEATKVIKITGNVLAEAAK